jgi:PII-like signaling protein
MRRIEGEQVLMRVFIGQSDQWRHTPLSTALVELFRARGLAGATVLQGVAGFGAASVLHEAHLFRLSRDLPVVIEVVDTDERLRAVLPEIDAMLSGGLVTFEKVRVIRYDAGPPDASRPA